MVHITKSLYRSSQIPLSSLIQKPNWVEADLDGKRGYMLQLSIINAQGTQMDFIDNLSIRDSKLIKGSCPNIWPVRSLHMEIRWGYLELLPMH